MSEWTAHRFTTGERAVAVLLPFALDDAWTALRALRSAMVRSRAPSFTRDEWAYLLQFVGRSTLEGCFRESFGAFTAADAPLLDAVQLARPRGTVAVWLPSNVSLLGPLVLLQLLLTGNRLLLKAPLDADSLTGEFLNYLLAHLPSGAFRAHVERSVHYASFSREDARNAEWAAIADLRIVFGSDAAAAAIGRLDHPVDSVGVAFADRRSEAWLHQDDLNDDVLRQLIAVFAIYGQAGCTSPSRVVLVDGDERATEQLIERLVAMWDDVVAERVQPAAASNNVLAWQRSLAEGLPARLVAGGAAVVVHAREATLPFTYPTLLPVTGQPLIAAISQLPANIQTIGVSPTLRSDTQVLAALLRTPVKRIVPVRSMHHFGPVWDGRRFWSEAFTHIGFGEG